MAFWHIKRTKNSGLQSLAMLTLIIKVLKVFLSLFLSLKLGHEKGKVQETKKVSKTFDQKKKRINENYSESECLVSFDCLKLSTRFHQWLEFLWE